MADENGTDAPEKANGETPQPNGEAQPNQQPQTRILVQYVRDLSFENVAVQKGKLISGQPEIAIQVGLDAKKKPEDDRYEVAIKLKVTSKGKDDGEMIFSMEIDYAGLFEVKNVPEAQLHPFLLIECPRLIFPFLRRVVHDVTRDGGYPPLNLEPFDFVALYRQELQRRAAAEGQGQVGQA
ncbi:protein-export chaperone SecB [Jannaschia aquimarina]|uniref:Protein-export protein SecB n=1 Tax=Jannaschia aquimarina TaxID=935700 RepID=A0A0D1EDF3_9RHOB|nr:protein-export chaperone SecB [Jannaschia aquimarina]KIT14961.1 Protein-export protein SecB [Jannaschia aquimarina]SNS60522.1 protein translocase subunit secB [Jannaschia aquimarina]